MVNKCYKKLSDICSLIADCVNKTAPKVDFVTPYKMLRTTNIKNGYIDFENVSYVTKEIFEKWTRRCLPQYGDIILTREAPVGEIGRFNIDSDNYFLGQRLFLYRANPELLDWNYLAYALLSPEMKGILSGISNGSTVAHIKVPDAEHLKIPYFPIKFQRKIGKILSNYDDLIENNNRRIKILEEMAQKIYKEWFVDFKFPGHETTIFKDSPLGKIPNDWEVKKVVELSTLSKGKSYKSSELVDKKDGLPFLNLKCVERDGGFKREGLKWFCGKYNDNQVVLPEDIIMAVTDMTQERKLVARPARIPHNWYKKYIMSMDLVKLVANNDINKTYLYSLLKYSNFSDEVKNHANGVNVLHLNPQNIEQFELVVASEPLRNNFGEFAKRIFNQIDVLYLKNENLKQTRDVLLPRLISGEINVENMEVL